MTLSDSRQDRRLKTTLRPLPSSRTGLPRLPASPFRRAVPTTPADRNGCTCRLLPRLTRPSPISGRVGIRIVLFEACSGFTRVTARTLAQPPKAAFVTRLRRSRLPGHAARQLPAQSTTRWVEPSSTSVSRSRGAPEFADIHRIRCSSFMLALRDVSNVSVKRHCTTAAHHDPTRRTTPTARTVRVRLSSNCREEPPAACDRTI